MWPFKPKPADYNDNMQRQREGIQDLMKPQPLQERRPFGLPPRPKTATVALPFVAVAALIPAVAKYSKTVPTPQSLADIYDTLLNSVVTPPPPWPQSLVRFQHAVSLPTAGGGVEVYFVFYPL